MIGAASEGAHVITRYYHLFSHIALIDNNRRIALCSIAVALRTCKADKCRCSVFAAYVCIIHTKRPYCNAVSTVYAGYKSYARISKGRSVVVCKVESVNGVTVAVDVSAEGSIIEPAVDLIVFRPFAR